MSERMRKKNGGKAVGTKQLFHGTTSEKYATAICGQNFDWRLSGSNVGTRFGKGSYFARDAVFAHSYTKSNDNNHRCMFVAEVLVGTCTTGQSEYTRPPPRDQGQPLGDLYDSCVNDTADPQIYVIFEKTQVYPEYLITYSERTTPTYLSSYTAQQSRAAPTTAQLVPLVRPSVTSSLRTRNTPTSSLTAPNPNRISSTRTQSLYAPSASRSQSSTTANATPAYSRPTYSTPSAFSTLAYSRPTAATPTAFSTPTYSQSNYTPASPPRPQPKQEKKCIVQ